MNSTLVVLEQLKQSFISELPDKISAIENDLLDCTEGNRGGEPFQSAYRRTHSLKGAGGTFGVSIFTAICHQLEDILTLWESKSFSHLVEYQARCLDYIDLLRQASEIIVSDASNFDSINEKLRTMQLVYLKDKLKVLIVDSSRTTRSICRQTISDFDVEVVEMDDGYEALGRLLYERFDVLIAGKEIGALNGEMLISLMSRRLDDMTMIMITSSNQNIIIEPKVLTSTIVVKKGSSMIADIHAQFEAIIR